MDDRSHPYVCAWQFVAKWVQPDSTTLTCSEDYEIDLRDKIDIGNGQDVYSARFAESVYSERASLMEKKFPELNELKGEAKSSKSDQLFSTLDSENKREIIERAEDKALRSLAQPRKFVVQRAQTGAMLRTIRKMLNLKQSYTLQELKEPFRIPRSRYDWERMDAVLGPQISTELKQLQALKILGISSEEFKSFRQIAAPVHTPDALEGIFEETKVEVKDSELAHPDQVQSPKVEEPVLKDDEMYFLDKIVKKTDKLNSAPLDQVTKDWIAKNIQGAFSVDKHYRNHLDDHFHVTSAINLSYEQIWAMYLHKHKGQDYPPQWVGKEKKKPSKKPPTGTSDLAKRIDKLEMASFYAYLQNNTKLGNVDTDPKAAQIMTDLCDSVEKGVYTIALEKDEQEMLETVKGLL